VVGKLGAHDLVVAADSHDRQQDAVVASRRRRSAALGQERRDHVEDLIRVDADEVVCPRQLDEARAGDALGDVAALFDAHVVVGAAVHDERGDADRREQRAHVDQRVHLVERPDGPGAGGGTASLAPPARHRLVG
jgi:hypothetical protein